MDSSTVSSTVKNSNMQFSNFISIYNILHLARALNGWDY